MVTSARFNNAFDVLMDAETGTVLILGTAVYFKEVTAPFPLNGREDEWRYAPLSSGGVLITGYELASIIDRNPDLSWRLY